MEKGPQRIFDPFSDCYVPATMLTNSFLCLHRDQNQDVSVYFLGQAHASLGLDSSQELSWQLSHLGLLQRKTYLWSLPGMWWGILCEVSPLSVGQTFQNHHLVVQMSCQPGESLSHCWIQGSVRCLLWRQPSWEFQSSAAPVQTSKDHPHMPLLPNKQTDFHHNPPGNHSHLQFLSLSQGQPPVHGAV